MREFREVAKVYKELSLLYMMNRSRPVYRTGNLYETISSYNTPNRMITQRKSRARTKFKLDLPSVNISLSFAPNVKGVKTGKNTSYGKFVHDGTSKMPARPFAEEAANDKRLKITIDNAIKGVVDEDVLPAIRELLDKSFKKFLK